MKKIFPYQTIGIIGGGQLGRMMCLAAKAMGYKVAVLDPTPDCPCAQVADIEIIAEYNDLDAIKKLASVSDVITYEFENIDHKALPWLEKNTYLPQGSEVLKITRHRFLEKSTIHEMGIPVAEFHLIESAEALEKKVFYPGVLKTTTLGYDGKGQLLLRSEADLPEAKKLAAQSECLLEKFVPFSKEISVIVARSTTGETKVFPVAENIHVNKILHQSIVPARISPELEQKAIECAKKIAESIGAIGVIGIEMFVVGDEIIINELAPRPHNSGHYTIDACVTSQFEQHVRAICGLPLGDTSLHTPVVMVNILGDHMDKNDLSNLSAYIPLLSAGKIHLYGKSEAKDGRKMGHVNILGEIEKTLREIDATKIWS
ncbi:MAG: 5-(carboxyamino)imidazole ribonucleotide synthase [Clostridiales bacterium]|jgi:5-(carboxyamino)imidazole ribonucleotide synthase|nr:5-(carboxyamino)imidazole ribonucleotide synthase [Clostridiales bacterium]